MRLKCMGKNYDSREKKSVTVRKQLNANTSKHYLNRRYSTYIPMHTFFLFLRFLCLLQFKLDMLFPMSSIVHPQIYSIEIIKYKHLKSNENWAICKLSFAYKIRHFKSNLFNHAGVSNQSL